jgi:hypothetical protein
MTTPASTSNRIIARADVSSRSSLSRRGVKTASASSASSSSFASPSVVVVTEKDSGGGERVRNNETMQISSLRPKEKSNGNRKGVISVPSKSRKPAPSSSNNAQSTTFLSPQFTEGLVLAIACVLGSSLSATLLALVPTLRAAANALNEVAMLAEALKEEIPDTLAAVRVSGLELTDALEEVGELTSEVTGVTKRTTRAIDMSLSTAQRVGGLVYEGSKTMVPNAKRQVKKTVKPMVRRTANEIEGIARERAAMDPYAGEIVSGVAATTKKGVGRARKAIEAAGVAKQIGQVYKAVKGKPSKVSD